MTEERGWRRRRTPSLLDAHLILIERRALCEPVVVETENRGVRPRATGFWRGKTFYRIRKILAQRGERGVSYLRVLADRGCFDLRRVTEIDPWTWEAQGRWELTADLAVVPVKRLSS
jgi:hypothetical protein